MAAAGVATQVGGQVGALYDARNGAAGGDDDDAGDHAGQTAAVEDGGEGGGLRQVVAKDQGFGQLQHRHPLEAHRQQTG